MDETGSTKSLLRFDLDGHDETRWRDCSPRFIDALRRLLVERAGTAAPPPIRELLHRLPPRGVDTVAAGRTSAGAQPVEVAERIIERYRAREAAKMAASQQRPGAYSESEIDKESERSSQLEATLRSRRSFLAGGGADRDLVIDGDLLAT